MRRTYRRRLVEQARNEYHRPRCDPHRGESVLKVIGGAVLWKHVIDRPVDVVVGATNACCSASAVVAPATNILERESGDKLHDFCGARAVARWRECFVDEAVRHHTIAERHRQSNRIVPCVCKSVQTEPMRFGGREQPVAKTIGPPDLREVGKRPALAASVAGLSIRLPGLRGMS